MKKKRLFIRSYSVATTVSFNKKSKIFNEVNELRAFSNEDFVMDNITGKLEFLECIIFLLANRLKDWDTPNIPNITYVPLDEMYLSVNVFKVDYKLLQGDERDNEIIILNNLRTLIKESIAKGTSIEFYHIDKWSELELLPGD